MSGTQEVPSYPYRLILSGPLWWVTGGSAERTSVPFPSRHSAGPTQLPLAIELAREALCVDGQAKSCSWALARVLKMHKRLKLRNQKGCKLA